MAEVASPKESICFWVDSFHLYTTNTVKVPNPPQRLPSSQVGASLPPHSRGQ
jgi:hypothetical protein